jgi:hypothetical protein
MTAAAATSSTTSSTASSPATIRIKLDFQFASSSSTTPQQDSLRSVADTAVLVLQKFVKVGAGVLSSTLCRDAATIHTPKVDSALRMGACMNAGWGDG